MKYIQVGVKILRLPDGEESCAVPIFSTPSLSLNESADLFYSALAEEVEIVMQNYAESVNALSRPIRPP